MAGELASAKREKSMAEFLLIVACVLLMMAIFAYYFFKQEDQYSKVAFERLANNFADKIVVTHGQWLMENRPKIIELKPLGGDYRSNSDSTAVNQVWRLNKNGWLDSNANNACYDIWRIVTETELTVLPEPISVLETQTSGQLGRICRYQLASGAYFDYNSRTGDVSTVKTH
ncbi:hypothetical protein J7384_04520 [Endozoicomonas sp. G2_1]|uniref:hypothetical protein n=1 Tax=Endozoicomonas sp. G2_1 TaxID=2821091 RepID=UPI001AD97550|nr:hypothetical protein [Endozoicomonas sp. G2_1]MBO9489622.1 hypothetical protein [Endozoicomonas sp. G2_1]